MLCILRILYAVKQVIYADRKLAMKAGDRTREVNQTI